ncbi:MAG TPA: M23 family metallopeptidase, partial [Candidatus Limnocylindrales bacterium]|nr:M23 family metallopeptidase [Candidatus Limnocylindrales bacterium]
GGGFVYVSGPWAWPVPGGYISQYFHYGHYAIDIAADAGTRAMAAAAGTVIFAGWKNNGGGYQVWIAHGSGLYTTYNHMMSVSVGRGQHVARGQQVGRVGMTGNATGPHLHFEVWRGPVWDGGTRVNPLIYL